MKSQQVRALVAYLTKQVARGYTIVTWNGVGFDFDILAEESGMPEKCKELVTGHVDMMFHVLCQLGFGVSLDAAVRGMRLPRKHKGLPGSLIPRLWAEGKIEEVLAYASQDVRITLALAKVCEERGYLRWITRHGTGRVMRLPNGWQTVEASQELPEPRGSWLRNQWSRDSFTAWMAIR
jgi:hypothetical protein